MIKNCGSELSSRASLPQALQAALAALAAAREE